MTYSCRLTNGFDSLAGLTEESEIFHNKVVSVLFYILFVNVFSDQYIQSHFFKTYFISFFQYYHNPILDWFSPFKTVLRQSRLVHKWMNDMLVAGKFNVAIGGTWIDHCFFNEIFIIHHKKSRNAYACYWLASRNYALTKAIAPAHFKLPSETFLVPLKRQSKKNLSFWCWPLWMPWVWTSLLLDPSSWVLQTCGYFFKEGLMESVSRWMPEF